MRAGKQSKKPQLIMLNQRAIIMLHVSITAFQCPPPRHRYRTRRCSGPEPASRVCFKTRCPPCFPLRLRDNLFGLIWWREANRGAAFRMIISPSRINLFSCTSRTMTKKDNVALCDGVTSRGFFFFVVVCFVSLNDSRLLCNRERQAHRK